MDKTNAPDVLTLKRPKIAMPVVFDSPHSGRHYPDDFNYTCSYSALEKIEDRHVEDLLSDAPDYGAFLLHAHFARTYIDVNRAREDIDPSLTGGAWPQEKYGKVFPSKRSDAGIGLISRLVKPGLPIYDRTLSAEEIMARIRNCYDPYHETLAALLDDLHYKYGQFWHINCHSMPAASAYPKQNIMMAGHRPKPSDIVLGDLDGQTCGRDYLYALRDFLKSKGLRVTINDPFKGVELIRKYSQPTRGKNSIQIEINRSLYMNEETGEKSENYNKTKELVTQAISFTCHFAQGKLGSIAAD